MRHPARLVLLLALLPASLAAQETGGSAYAIGGIAVDVAAPNPEAARMTAYRLAQRKAWPLLWSRLTGQPAGGAPRLSDGQLDSIVAGIESQGERFSATRYIATLGVIFDRSRASDFFGGASGMLTSPPMLLLPMQVEGGAATLYQARTPWRAAWQRFRENVTPVDYVMAGGSAADNLLLTGWQVWRQDRTSWRTVLNRFDTVDVLTAEARLTRQFPGGPIDGLFIARHGPDAAELGRFTLQAPGEEGLDAMLDTAVRRIDEIYSIALRDGRLRAEPDLAADLEPLLGAVQVVGGSLGDAAEAAGADVSSLELAVATPDAAAVRGAETLLRATAGVTGTIVTSLSLGGTTRIVVNHQGSFELLAFTLDQKGWRLERASDGSLVLRRRREGETPLPPPVVPAAPTGAPATGAPTVPPPTVSPPAAPVPTPTAAPPGDAGRRRPAPAAATPAGPSERRNGPVDLLPPQT